MNNNLGVFGTLVCVALAWGVGCFFGVAGAVIGGIFFVVTLVCILDTRRKDKLAALDRQTQATLRRVAELKKRNDG